MIYKTTLIVVVFIINCFPQWVTAEGPYGGRITSISESKLNGLTTLFTTVYGGAYSSTDRGENWKPLISLLNDEYYTIKAFETKSGENYVLAGGHNYAYISSDNGLNWRSLGNLPGIGGGVYLYDTDYIDDSTRVDLLSGTSTGLYLSSNYGYNWQKISAVLGDIYINAVAVPKSIPFNNMIFIAAYYGDGIYFSKNKGNTWERIDTIHHSYCTSLATFINQDGNLVLLVGKEDGVRKFIFSNDSTWYELEESDLNSMINSVKVYNNSGIYTIYAAGGLSFSQECGIFISTNEGATWVKRNVMDNFMLECHISDDKLYAGTTQGGIYVSIDNGVNWTTRNGGLNGTSIYYMLSDQDASGQHFTFAGTHSGVFRNWEGENGWEFTTDFLANLPIRAFAKVMDSLGNKEIITGTTKGIFKTTDFGYTWNATDSLLKKDVFSLLAFQNLVGDINIYVGSVGGIWRSTNNGKTWGKLSSTINQPVVEELLYLKQYNYIISAAYNKGIFISSDYGDTWTDRTSGLPNNSIRDIKSLNESEIFVSLYPGGVYYSSDFGINWISRSSNLATLNIQEILVLPQDKGIIAASDYGVFYSSNKGISWKSVGQGLPSAQILTLNLRDTLLFAGTNYKGIFKRPLKEIVTAIHDASYEVPVTYQLFQNYPNPFNPVTTIRYQIPNSGQVSLKIYDILGREITELINEYKSAGVYEKEFNASALSSGIYIYELKSNQYRVSKKLILLK